MACLMMNMFELHVLLTPLICDIKLNAQKYDKETKDGQKAQEK
jgi:chromatin remodeling complex protein RSC6